MSVPPLLAPCHVCAWGRWDRKEGPEPSSRLAPTLQAPFWAVASLQGGFLPPLPPPGIRPSLWTRARAMGLLCRGSAPLPGKAPFHSLKHSSSFLARSKQLPWWGPRGPCWRRRCPEAGPGLLSPRSPHPRHKTPRPRPEPSSSVSSLHAPLGPPAAPGGQTRASSGS